MTGPVLDQVNIVVRDMEAAVAFYRRLGVDIPDEAPPWDRHHRSATTAGDGLDLDLDSHEFAIRWGMSEAGVLLTFRFEQRDEVDAAYADLTGAGYPGRQEPYDAFWGSRFAIVADPDGNAIGLMTRPDPAFRKAPPEIT